MNATKTARACKAARSDENPACRCGCSPEYHKAVRELLGSLDATLAACLAAADLPCPPGDHPLDHADMVAGAIGVAWAARHLASSVRCMTLPCCHPRKAAP